MKLRARLITLLAVSIMATALAPLGAQAARPSNSAKSLFSEPREYTSCSTAGSGLCTVVAAADEAGRMTGTVTSAVKEDPLTGVTGTASSSAKSGYNLSFMIPRSGASSVTFTVDVHVNSASAMRSNPLQNAHAEVSFRSTAIIWSNNCTSCTVTDLHVLADSVEVNDAPTTVENKDESFTFVLTSKAGDRLKGRVDISIRLSEWAWAGVSGGPIPMEGTAEARGDAVLKNVTATFNP